MADHMKTCRYYIKWVLSVCPFFKNLISRRRFPRANRRANSQVRGLFQPAAASATARLQRRLNRRQSKRTHGIASPIFILSIC